MNLLSVVTACISTYSVFETPRTEQCLSRRNDLCRRVLLFVFWDAVPSDPVRMLAVEPTARSRTWMFLKESPLKAAIASPFRTRNRSAMFWGLVALFNKKFNTRLGWLNPSLYRVNKDTCFRSVGNSAGRIGCV